VRPALHQAYRKFRAEHGLAFGLNAFNYAKGLVNNPRPSLDWDDPPSRTRKYGEEVMYQAEWDDGPFHFVAQLVPDNDHSLLDDEDFCQFVRLRDRDDKYERRPDREAVWVEAQTSGRDYVRGWFVSQYSYDERRRDYAKQGYSRQAAHEAARAALRKEAKWLEGWLGDDWQFVGVSVSATVGGVSIDSEDLWGIEAEYGRHEYHTETALELAGQVKYKALKEIEGEIDAALQRVKAAVEARMAVAEGEDKTSQAHNAAKVVGTDINALINLRARLVEMKGAPAPGTQAHVEHTCAVEQEHI
jgi:hypothetical protein